MLVSLLLKLSYHTKHNRRKINMDQSKDTTFHQKGKHFSKTDRRELQGILRTAKLLGQSLSLRKLAKLMHCAPNTIRNELKRGAHPHTGHYGAARAQRDYNRKHQNSCTKHKRFVASPFVTWAIQKVKQFHWSLDACVGYARLHSLFPKEQMVCTKTLYNYVDACLFQDVRNIDLPLKVRRRTHPTVVRQRLKKLGRSLEERPTEVTQRAEFGHWEIDTVIGRKSKTDKAVLSLCERQTRKYIGIPIAGKNAEAVKVGLLRLKKWAGSKFSEIFKTITADNGSEFADLSSLEQDTKTTVYFAHPYSAWERPSNERANGLLRRFIPKYRRIDGYDTDEIYFACEWANDLPRKILGYHTPNELFEKELDRIYMV